MSRLVPLGDIVAYLARRAADYPADIFPDPPRGEHGKTIDACSARAIRTILGSCIKELESGEWIDHVREVERLEPLPSRAADRGDHFAEMQAAHTSVIVSRARCATCGGSGFAPGPVADSSSYSDLDALDAARRAAAPGPYRVWDQDPAVGCFWKEGLPVGSVCIETLNGIGALGEAIGAGTDERNARWIIAACNAVPKLVAELRKLRAVLKGGLGTTGAEAKRDG